MIRDDWDDGRDLAAMSAADRDRLWGRQILNPYALHGYRRPSREP